MTILERLRSPHPKPLHHLLIQLHAQARLLGDADVASDDREAVFSSTRLAPILLACVLVPEVTCASHDDQGITMGRFSYALLCGPLLVLCLATACGKRSTAPDAPAGKLETATDDSWPLHEVPAQGFALALPPDWRPFDMNPATFEANLKEWRLSPEFEATMRQQMAAGMKFFGMDSTTMKPGLGTSVSVLRSPLPPGATLDGVVAESVSAMERQPGVAGLTHERVTLPAGECERLYSRLTKQSPRGPRTFIILQFVFVKGGNVYVVTFTTSPEQEAKYTATFDKIAKSFRFMK